MKLDCICDEIENKIAEKLKQPLTCQEIHELAAAYAELAKTGGPFYFCGCDLTNERDEEVQS